MSTMNEVPTLQTSRSWPFGSGEMAKLVRQHAWTSTPLGSLDGWKHNLRTTVDLVLACPIPMVVLYGPALVQIYNDSFRLVMGNKHPGGLGQATRECWPEVWHINEPIYSSVLSGEALTFEDRLYPIDRHGYLEDAWFTVTYSPLRDESQIVVGVLVTVFETTVKSIRMRPANAAKHSSKRLRNFCAPSECT